MDMERFNEIYDHMLQSMDNLVKDIRFSRDLNLNSIKTSVVNLSHCLKESSNVIKLLNAVKNRDKYLYTHSVNVAVIAFTMGNWMNMKESDLFRLTCAGLLHDIGKAKIKDRILNKSDKLNGEELKMVREHPKKGFSLLTRLGCFDGSVLMGILSHHEREDGSGYPLRLKGSNIHLFAKIIAIADSYDAMISEKSYNSSISPFKAIEEIAVNSSVSLNPQICRIFLKNIINAYHGSMVRLNNETVGEIVYIDPQYPTRPVIRCEEETINLLNRMELEILDLI